MNSDPYKKSQRIFRNTREDQSRFEDLPEDQVRCPVCWKLFPAERLSVEHVPSRAIATLVKEDTTTLLTCRACNNLYGGTAEGPLFHYVKGLQGKFRNAGVTVNGIRTRAELDMSGDHTRIVNINKPSANDPKMLQESADAFANGEPSKLTFSLDWQLSMDPSSTRALLRSAYLALVAIDRYEYAYSNAGASVRGLLNSENLLRPGNYCLKLNRAPKLVKINGPWVVRLDSPLPLQAYWIKICGHLVVMPIHDGDVGVFESYWQRAHMDRMVSAQLMLDVEKLSVTYEGQRDQLRAILCQLPARWQTET